MKSPTSILLHSILLAGSLAALQPTVARGESASPSELLEKGIYSQETKGDLDAAITIYRQLVADAKTTQSLAAEAQLRLGECLLKKNRQGEALAAFEKLIQEFPGERELVAKARGYLPGELALLPVPWANGERLQMVLTLAGGKDIGAMELRADLVEAGGAKAWRVGRRMSAGSHMLSSVDVEADTFRPLASYWRHTQLGTVSATFKQGEVEMRREGTNEPTTVRPDKVVFDNEEVMHLLRRLPLREGYRTTLPVITTLGGGAILPIGIDVPRKERVETTAGTYDCFKVVLDVGQSFWIADHPHRTLVKFDGGGATGTLTALSERPFGAAVNFGNTPYGVSLVAPADWVVHLSPSDDTPGEAVIHLLDPAAEVDHAGIHLKATDRLPAAARVSPRAFADHDRVQAEKERKDLKVRPDSWRNTMVAGRPAVSCIAEYTQSGKPMSAFLVYTVGPKTCTHFILACDKAKLDAQVKAFEGIIASYRTTK